MLPLSPPPLPFIDVCIDRPVSIPFPSLPPWQALEYIGERIKIMRKSSREYDEEARELLAAVILQHIPVEKFNFFGKVRLRTEQGRGWGLGVCVCWGFLCFCQRGGVGRSVLRG